MRMHHGLIVLFLVAGLSACGAAGGRDANAGAVQDSAAPGSPAQNKTVNPMASFARLTPGEWRQTALAGTCTYDTWHWGPGQHSVRVMTDGLGTSVVPEPWRELQVFYWHPGRREVRLFGLSPFARGVSEGTITFDGETADGVFDLYQTYGVRKLGLRWDFDGPDKYHDVLLEATGPEGFKPMNQWDHVRTKGAPEPRPPAAKVIPEFSAHLKAFERLLGHTWEAAGEGNGDRALKDASHIRSTFEWIPYADGIYVRTEALTKGGEPAHLLDTYFYHHTGRGVLRCLALSREGGVYEGDVKVLDGGALEIDLKGYQGEQVTSYVVRFEFERDGQLRQRAWSVDGAERTLVIDVRHKRLEAKKD